MIRHVFIPAACFPLVLSLSPRPLRRHLPPWPVTTSLKPVPLTICPLSLR